MLVDVLGSSGSLADRIDEEKTTQSDLNKRRTQLQDKLATLQDRYTAQYAALDALLFKLNRFRVEGTSLRAQRMSADW